MVYKEAKEILKQFESYKIFPLAWPTHNFDGSPTAMAIAEAKGYIEGSKYWKRKADELERILDKYFIDREKLRGKKNA